MRKEILIRERAGRERTGENVRVALPCARGEVRPETPLHVLTPAGTVKPCQHRVLKTWPDGSVKWALLDFQVDVPASGEAAYFVSPAAAEVASPLAVEIIPGAERWRVETGVGSFLVDTRTYRPFLAVLHQGKEVLPGASACIFCADGGEAAPEIERIETEDAGPLHAVLRLSGRFPGGAGTELRFVSRLHFFAGTMTVEVEFTLHNPRAAKHPGGLWDLGGAGSALFRQLLFRFPLPAGGKLRLSSEPDGEPIEATTEGEFGIYQESSGGENWRSANHRTRSGEVPVQRKGYVVESAGEEVASGLRGAPTMWCGAGGLGVAAAIPHFWQEFPKALGAADGALTVELFPARFPDLHELQGGEQKTHRFLLDFAAEPDVLRWAHSPLMVTASPRDYRESGIFTDLPGDDDLIDLFVKPSDILAKREVADEFGWRNFGELYADHEAVYHQGKETFVSHYNNQYDFCAGAYRKSFATADAEWRELAADLARHVRDIDLYHTDLDREEYNRGLFWHTDHYIDAGLSSHRSYSREQLQTKPHTGGGPGPEHCYTTGLMLHYFQTGDPAFRDAVVSLADWVLRALSGSTTVLGTLKRGAGHLSQWRSCRGARRLFPRYPLTRGTGNAVSACLDAFEVGGGRSFLDRAEELIRGALHPGDDLEARHLLEAEIAWSYTVLLVAVAKYLDKKRELGELDDGFHYARSSFLAYASWMLQHEYPYLERPEILEYPNETWAAQDLRKTVIYYHAARYGKAQEGEFRSRGRNFFESARQELLRRETSTLSRPLTLMLQNGWAGARISLREACEEGGRPAEAELFGAPIPALTLGSVAARLCTDLGRAAKNTTLAQELAWMNARMAK